MTSRRSPRAESGSAAVEMVIVAPVLMLITMAVVGIGRVEQADLDAQTSAGAAARAAALARTPEQAVAAAKDMLVGGEVSCAKPSVKVDTTSFRPGGSVSVAVTCRPSMADVTGLGLPGSVSITERATDGIDQWRAAGQP